VLNFIVSSDDMDLVRAELELRGAGATIAGWMRDAIREKLARDAQVRELYSARMRDQDMYPDPMGVPLPDPQAPQSGVRRTQQNDHGPQKAPRFKADE
jgi:hypothetical protein